MKMIKYALSRYAYFLSYVAAFLAGVAVVVPAVYMLIPLAAAVLLGSASSYYRRSSVQDKRPMKDCKVTTEFCNPE